MTGTSAAMTRARDSSQAETPERPDVAPLGGERHATGSAAAIETVSARAKLILARLRARYVFVDVALRTFRRYSDDDVGSYAAALTYYTFFAVFPLLLFGAAMLGYLTFGNEDLRQRILKSAVDFVPLLRTALSEESLDLIEAKRQTLAFTGLGLALYAGTGMLVALGHALDRINKVENEGSFVQKRLRALKWLALLGLAAVGSVAITVGTGFLPGVLSGILGFVAGVVVNVFIFTTAFKFLPAKRLRWHEVWPGAVIAAIGFELLKTLGAFYLAKGATAREETFGTLAGAATLLVAAYLISQIILLAAEVNAALAERRKTRVLKATTEEAT